MSRIPPNLVYLTIYNPSLRSAHSPNADDEDAEEQAHILFYTSKEKAVSRDRMLRQIGLAKALVNFSECLLFFSFRFFRFFRFFFFWKKTSDDDVDGFFALWGDVLLGCSMLKIHWIRYIHKREEW